MRQKFGLLFLLLTLCACSYHQRNTHRIVEVTPGLTPEAHQKNFLYSQQAYGGTYVQDPSLSKYIQEQAHQCSLNSINPSLKCSVAVVNSSIPNIWSFQGGYIAITRGLLLELENEAELMAVLSHEISHLNQQDGRANIQKVILNAGPVKLDQQANYYVSDFAVGPLGSGSGLLTLKYDVQSEISADQMSIHQMKQMGYAPSAILDLQRRMHIYKKSGDPNWIGGYLAKHPLSDLQLNKCESCQKPFEHLGQYKSESFSKQIRLLKSQQAAYDQLDLGYKALLNSKYEKAIELAEHGLSLLPNEIHFLLLKAKAQTRLGYMTEALKTLNRAIGINPYYFDLFLQRGLVKEQLDDWVEACHDLERSLALLPTAEAYYALGEIDYSKDRQAEAIEYFRKASISASPGGKRALKKLQKLGLPLSGVQTLEVRPYFTESGHLNIEVENKGHKVARAIVIDVEQCDPKGKLLFRYFIEIKKDLNPLEVVSQQTNIGPFFSKEHMLQSTSLYPVYCE